nr:MULTISPECIES: hypothetical protein [unclassified Acinetobacter]
MLSKFFIERPIFAGVLAIIVMAVLHLALLLVLQVVAKLVVV